MTAALREATPDTSIEVLTPDFLRKHGAEETAKPDIFNHNLKTVPRLYVSVRPGARYFNSLRLLDRGKQLDPTMIHRVRYHVRLGRERRRGPPGHGRPARGRCRFPDEHQEKGQSAFETITEQSFPGKWTIIYTYPKDFTFVCPTEIAGFGQTGEGFRGPRCGAAGRLDR